MDGNPVRDQHLGKHVGSLRRSFGMFGIVVGIIAASVFLPDGCGINAAQSDRLRLGMPILFFAALFGLGWLLDRRLRLNPTLAWWKRVLWVTASISVLAVGSAAVYGSLEATGIAFIALWPALVAVAAGVLFTLWTSSAAATVPYRAPAWRAYSIMRRPILAGFGGIFAGVWWAAMSRPVDLRLATAGLVLSALVLATGAWALVRLRWAERALAVGGGPYREAPEIEWTGDDRHTRRRVARARVVATSILALGIAGWTAGLIGVLHSPPPHQDTSPEVGFRWGHC